MSLRPAQWQFFGVSPARRASEPERERKARNPNRPNLTLVEGSKNSKSSKKAQARRIERLSPGIRLVGMIGVVIAVLFGVVAFHVMLSQGQFQLNALEKKADEQQTQYERLRAEVAQLESPQRITSEAINRLGLVPADKVTPVTPGEADMPNGRSDQTGTAPTTTTSDPGQWNRVKPHLSSATK